MKVIFLGTNGWYDTETGNTPCVLVQTGNEHIVFDAGFGLHKLTRYIKDDKPIYLFISHLHFDHIIGLHVLPIFRFNQGVDIYTQPASQKILESVMIKPFTRPLAGMSPLVRLHEYAPNMSFPFGFETLQLLHAVPCYGFRVTAAEKSVTFCTDTEDCPNLHSLARGTHLLITECAFRSDEETVGSFHLNPRKAAMAAREAGARQLALYHFDPGRYPTFDDRARAEREAAAVFPSTTAVIDGQEIIL